MQQEETRQTISQSLTQARHYTRSNGYRSVVTSPLAILTGVNDVPHFSYASTSLNLDVKEQYPISGRTVTSSVGEAAVVL